MLETDPEPLVLHAAQLLQRINGLEQTVGHQAARIKELRILVRAICPDHADCAFCGEELCGNDTCRTVVGAKEGQCNDTHCRLCWDQCGDCIDDEARERRVER